MNIQELLCIENNVLKSKLDVNLPPNYSVPLMVFQAWKKKPKDVLLVDCSRGTQWTGSELSLATRKVIAALSSDPINISKGDVVAFFAQNSDWQTIAMISSSALGAVFTSAVNFSTVTELTYMVKQANVSHIICDTIMFEKSVAVLQNIAKDQVKTLMLLDLDAEIKDWKDHGDDRIVNLYNLINKVQPVPELKVMADIDAATDLYQISFSSGTTGPQKAIARTHYSSCYEIVGYPGYSFPSPTRVNEPVFLSIIGYCWQPGTIWVLLCFHYGIKICICADSGNLDNWFSWIHKYKVTVITVTSILKTRIRNYMKDPENAEKLSKLNLSSLHEFVVAGEVSYPEETASFMQLLPSIKKVRVSYGSTETGKTSFTPLCLATAENVRSAGIPIPGTEIKIIPPPEEGSHDIFSEEALPANQVGEICMKGPLLFKEYIDNEEAMAKSFTSDGFFRTGDGGYFTPEGLLYITDRYKDTFKVNMIPVSPSELEEFIIRHPGVKEAVVVGVPHPTFNYVPKAFITVEKGIQEQKKDQIIREIHEMFTKDLSGIKHLRGGIQVLDEIPRTKTSNKIDRKLLRTDFSEIVDNNYEFGHPFKS